MSKFVCTNDYPIAETARGKIRGFLYNDVFTFYGIRYAVAKRFEMPEAIPAWEGVRDALSFGYIMLQTVSATFAINADTPPMLAAWIPNILYSFIAYFCYRQAPN